MIDPLRRETMLDKLLDYLSNDDPRKDKKPKEVAERVCEKRRKKNGKKH
jgi:hypothetical protein